MIIADAWFQGGSLELDIWRTTLIALGGICSGANIPLVKMFAEDVYKHADMRWDDVVMPTFLRAVAHSLALLFIVGVIIERGGNSNLSWYAPAATIVFTVSIVALWITFRRNGNITQRRG